MHPSLTENVLTEQDYRHLKTMNVLFAEDDLPVIESMEKILNHYFGYVMVCHDGINALVNHRKQHFDLVILDIKMPGMDGLEVARLIREETPERNVVVLTSYDSVEPLRRAIPLGLMDYLVKPLEIEAFEILLKKILAAGGKLNTDPTIALNRHCYYDRGRNVIVRKDLPEYAHPLSTNETTLLEMLIERRGDIVHLEEIDTRIYEGQMTSHAIRNLLLRLREKLMDRETITTHRGVGYSWRQ